MSLTVTSPSVIETLPGGSDTCPVCGALDFTSIYNDARDPITLDSFRVAECSGCGTAYTIPRPASLDRYYPHHYRAYGPFITRILSTFYGLRVSRWARIKPEGGSVLEVGLRSRFDARRIPPTWLARVWYREKRSGCGNLRTERWEQTPLRHRWRLCRQTLGSI
jgi:hypothetical protein